MPEFISQAQIRSDLDEFTRGYVECALWLMTDEEGNSCDDFDGEISDYAYEDILRDCQDFQSANAALLQSYVEMGRVFECFPFAAPLSHAGHDFFLSRNGHGTGFWDRGMGSVGDALHKAAEVYGDQGLYIDVGNEAYVM